MQGDSIIIALIGLTGAVSNNGRTEETDRVIRKGFLEMENGEGEEEMVQKIHAVKNTIAPDCAVCKNPCGNTSDYDMTQYYDVEQEVFTEKKKLIEAIQKCLKTTENVTDDIYRGIAYLGYRLEPEQYRKLRIELCKALK